MTGAAHELVGQVCVCGGWRAPLGRVVAREFDRHLLAVLPPPAGTAEGVWATPEVWVEWFLGLDDAQQLAVAAARLELAERAHRCFIQNHDGLLARCAELERLAAGGPGAGAGDSAGDSSDTLVDSFERQLPGRRVSGSQAADLQERPVRDAVSQDETRASAGPGAGEGVVP